jgi:7tm Odorant receptor
MCRQIYFPCFYANEVTFKSELVLTEAYRSQWFDQDEEYKKILKIFMERIKSPIRMSALGVVDINLQTFLRVKQLVYQ